MQRRHFVHAAGLLALGVAGSACTHAAAQKSLASAPADEVAEALARIERDSGGRLGVAVLDTRDGRSWAHRGDERFPMCSTFKMLLAAATLARVDARQERLDRRIAVRQEDLVPYAPVTGPRVGGEPLTVAALCEATLIWSDNPAANLLLAPLGGPAALTAWLRGIGDATTRLDRNEPGLNTAEPGDPRDTTTPRAMLATMRTLLLGQVLSDASRDQLRAWMLDNRTGDAKLRAGVPAGWRVADKTGSGAHGTTNDVGGFWPPGRAPVFVTAYLTGTRAAQAQRDAALAAVARVAVQAVGA